ncbi:MAG: phospholipase D family protein [Bacteroidota bacterium]
MGWYIFSFIAFLLFISPSINHSNSTKKNVIYCESVTSHSESIIDALALSKEKMKTETGIYTLENGGYSLISRLWFFEHAQKTIDIQYYSFAKDITGLIASDFIVQAANRGVKVRILVDDAASTMYSYEIQLLDCHPNIDIKVYNAGLKLGMPHRRIKKTLQNSNRLLRRMHNKTLSIDGLVSIMGGRNIADRYFDYDHKYNFRDRDVILFGKAVTDVERSFDTFWNDELTIPYTELSGKNNKYNDSARFTRLHADAIKNTPSTIREKIDSYSTEFKKTQSAEQFDWVKQVSFISDKPGKNEDKQNRKGGIITDSIKALFNSAKTSIDLQSPYFIITEVGEQMITDAIKRGVKIRLLTNSLGSTDNYEAFSGYQRDRDKILKIGIQIYEFKPDAKERFKLMTPDVQTALEYKPVYGLHSKTILIDGFITVIGSCNFDPRSADYNTECITVIRSKEVTKKLSKHIEEEFLPENSWYTTLDFNADSKAGFKKNLKAKSRRILPKKLL